LFINGNIVQPINSRRVNVDSESSVKFGHRCSPPIPRLQRHEWLLLNGRIDEVELFNRAVPDSQIRAIYRAGRAGKCEPVSGTVTGIKLDEVTCHAGGGKSATL